MLVLRHPCPSSLIFRLRATHEHQAAKLMEVLFFALSRAEHPTPLVLAHRHLHDSIRTTHHSQGGQMQPVVGARRRPLGWQQRWGLGSIAKPSLLWCMDNATGFRVMLLRELGVEAGRRKRRRGQRGGRDRAGEERCGKMSSRGPRAEILSRREDSSHSPARHLLSLDTITDLTVGRAYPRR